MRFLLPLCLLLGVVVGGCASAGHGPAMSNFNPAVATGTGGSATTSTNNAAATVEPGGAAVVANSMTGLQVMLGGEENPAKGKELIRFELASQVGVLQQIKAMAEQEVGALKIGNELTSEIPLLDLSMWATLKVAYPHLLNSLPADAQSALTAFYFNLSSINMRIEQRFDALGRLHPGAPSEYVNGTASRADTFIVQQIKELLDSHRVELVVSKL